MAKKYTEETLTAAIDAGQVTNDNLIPLLTAGELSSDLATFALKYMASSKYTVEVSPKGCVNLKGLRQMGCAYYRDEWEVMFSLEGRFKAFVAAHPELKTKKDAMAGRAA